MYTLINSFSKVWMGRIGNLEKEMDTMSFLNFVKKQLNTKLIRYSTNPGKTINNPKEIKKTGSCLPCSSCNFFA